MKINNKNMSEFKGVLLSRKIGNANIQTIEDWDNGKLTPFRHSQYEKYTDVTCEIFINAENTQELETNKSLLIYYSKSAIIDFEDLDVYYEGYLESNDNIEKAKGKNIITLTWQCQHAYSKKETVFNFNRQSSTTIQLTSTATTPCILEIKPSIDLVTASITGFGEDITIKNLTAGNKIIIDGEKGLVTENGQNKWPDYDSWGFPKLEPGINEINSDIEITVKYKPRWL